MPSILKRSLTKVGFAVGAVPALTHVCKPLRLRCHVPRSGFSCRNGVVISTKEELLMSPQTLKFIMTAIFALCALASAAAQAPSYGPNISLEDAKKAAAAALAEARKNNWTMAVAIVDTAGVLVYYEKMDNT